MGLMRLSSYMGERGLSDADMAALICDCSASAVKKWRNGMRIPRPRFLARIRDVTDGEVSFNDFVPMNVPADGDAA